MNKQHGLTKKQKMYLPVKRCLDIAISIPACILLIPVMFLCAAAIKIDSPGPVLFKQKRIGKDKTYFDIWKFRTMRTDAPKDIPTHMFSDPESYITKTGRFMRKYSMDELPQIYQVLFTDKLSWIGPRPALWNQSDLVEERDKYGVNGLKPGITGWAQINGRDELEIPDKARLDGEYVKKFGFWMDAKCFLGTIGSVINHDGVKEGGGTGEIHRQDGNTSRKVSSKKIRKEAVVGGIVLAVLAAVGGAVLLRFTVKHIKEKQRDE